MMSKRILILLLSFSFMLLSGCATTNGDPRDPIEGVNRAVFQFNEGFDRMIFKPVAKGYKKIVPEPVNQGVSNFFGNLEDVITIFNNLMQFKFKQGASDTVRVFFNTTIGLLGVFDVASGMGIEKNDEDFGQTLGYWGVGAGPYLMLPFLGPSTVRDLTGGIVDGAVFDPIFMVDHIPTRNTLLVTKMIDQRADLLGASNVMEQAALDRYDFLRESYFQKRENDINDGDITFEDLDTLYLE